MKASLLALMLLASPCAAQRTVNSAMIWAAAFGDHRFGAKSSLYWDYHARRADAGETWQIQLGSVGYTRDLSKQWRATAAMGWSLGYRYGAFLARTNTAELRPWLQITGTRPVGEFTWSDRSRVEFRLLHPRGDLAPPDADWAPTVVRLRRQDRFQHSLTSNKLWYGAVSQEWLVNVLPSSARIGNFEQSRSQFVIGHQLNARNRIESGYGLQVINRRGGRELNHSLLLNFRSSVPF